MRRPARLLTSARAGLVRLSDREIDWVTRTSAAARRRRLESTAIAVSWLGNGLLYLLLAMLLLAWAGTPAWRAIAASALAGAVSHVVYPLVKRAGSRPRPFEHCTSLDCAHRPLDVHSFPSGHAMTLAATLTPALMVWPSLWPAALGLWLLVAWSRIAVGHHYPSDVLAGTLLGTALALPVAAVAL